jgi:hypothetical protein
MREVKLSISVIEVFAPILFMRGMVQKARKRIKADT